MPALYTTPKAAKTGNPKSNIIQELSVSVDVSLEKKIFPLEIGEEMIRGKSRDKKKLEREVIILLKRRMGAKIKKIMVSSL